MATRTISLHIPSPTENAQRAANVQTDPNAAPNLIRNILAAAPGTSPAVASQAAISGQLHATDFAAQGQAAPAASTTASDATGAPAAPMSIGAALAQDAPASAATPVMAAATSSHTIEWAIGLAALALVGLAVVRRRHPAPAMPR